MIATDVSKYALCVVMRQLQAMEKKDERYVAYEWVTIRYWSKTIISAEQNYSSTKPEFPSVVWASKTLHPNVSGTEFLVRPYHDALLWMITMNYPHGLLSRWWLIFSNFDFTVVY